MEPRDREMAALLVLLRSKARSQSWGSVAADVADAGSASMLLAIRDDGLFPSMDFDAALVEAGEEIARWHAAGLAWMTVLDSGYPERLLDIRETPPFVFYKGIPLQQDRGMSVVGSRSATDWGVADSLPTPPGCSLA